MKTTQHSSYPSKRCVSLLLALIVIACSLLPTCAIAQEASTTSALTSSSYQLADEKALNSYYLGDVSVDGVVNTGDATMLLRFSVGILELRGVANRLADANGDGLKNTGDAVEILRVSVELVPLQTVELDTYDVLFQSEYDTDNVPTSFLCVSGDAFRIPETILTHTGDSFLGWHCNVTDELVASGSDYTMPAQNVTFTARWQSDTTEQEYTITIIGEDLVNKVELCRTTATITETTLFTTACIELPEGFFFYKNSQKITVIVDDNGPDTTRIVFNMYTYDMIENSKYIAITTASGFDFMREHMINNYILKADIVMPDERFTPIGWLEDGTDTAFHYIFDGNGHTISNFNCDWWDKEHGELTQNVGLFAVVNGTVKNLRIETTTYKDNSQSYGVYGGRKIGIICGMITNNGIISNCEVTGCIGSSDSELVNNAADPCGGVGGIAGHNYGLITRCNAVVAIDAYFYAGGLCGKNFGDITESWAGICANSQTPDEVLMTTHMRYIGGLAGGCAGTIENCYSLILGLTQSNSCVGGLIGVANAGIYNAMYVATIAENSLGAYTNVGLFAGYCTVDPEIQTGVYNFTDGAPWWPEEFSHDIWDDNGTCYGNMPDLTYNRRPMRIIFGLDEVSRIMS